MKWSVIFLFSVLYAPLCRAHGVDKVAAVPALEAIDTVVIEGQRWTQSIYQTADGVYDVAQFLLKETPIHIRSYGGVGLHALSYRGMGASQASVLWQGEELNSPNLGQFDWSLLQLGQSELSLQNSNELNAQVGIELRDKALHQWKLGVHPDSLVFDAQIQAMANSNALFQEQVYLSLASPRMWVSANASYQHGPNRFLVQFPNADQNYRETHASGHVLNHEYNMAYRLKGEQVLQLAFWHIDADRELPSFGRINDRSIEDQEDYSKRLVLSFEQSADKPWNYRSSFFAEGSGIRYTNTQPEIDSRATWSRYSLQQTVSRKANNWSVQLKGKALVEGVQTANYLEDKTRQSLTAEVLSQYRWSAQWNTQLNLRYDWVSDVQAPLRWSVVQSYLEPSKKGQWCTTVAYKNRIPTFNDLYWGNGGNPDLAVEHGWHIELQQQRSWRVAKQPLTWQVQAFYLDQQDWIQWVPSVEGPWSPRNVKRVRSYGIEQVWNYRYKQWRMKAMLNLQDFKVDHQGQEQVLLYAPKWSGQSSISRQLKTWKLGLQLYAHGRAFSSSDGRFFLPNVYDLGAQVQKRFDIAKRPLVLQASATNLLGRTNYTVLNRPAVGRTIQININYKFNL